MELRPRSAKLEEFDKVIELINYVLEYQEIINQL